MGILATSDYGLSDGSNGLLTGPTIQPTGYGQDTEPQVDGVQSATGIARLPTTVSEASRQVASFDEIYNRVYILPAGLSLGSFSGTAPGTLTVWNAYEDASVSLTGLVGSTNIIFVGGPVLPLGIGALGTQTISISVADGDTTPTVAESVSFTFTVPGSVFVPATVVSVTGTRLAPPAEYLWPFKPNWGRALSVSMEHRTSIFTSSRGNEQRTRLRESPRMDISFPVLLRNSNRNRFNRIVTEYQKGVIVVPDYTAKPVVFDVSTYTAFPQPTGLAAFVIRKTGLAESMFVDETAEHPWWMGRGGLLHLTAPDGREMYAEVRAINPTLTTVIFELRNNIGAGSWPIGTIVRPARRCYMGDEIQGSNPTNHVYQSTINFRVLPGVNLPEPTGRAEYRFLGRELWLMKPNWSRDIEQTDLHMSEYMDVDKGRVTKFVDIEFHSQRFRMLFSGLTELKRDRIRRFWLRQSGQLNEFFVPTWMADIEPLFGVLAGDTVLTVGGIEFGVLYGSDTTRAGLMVVLLDGTQIIRQVMSITTDSTNSYIQVDESWGVDFDLEDVVMVCWVNLCRMASDEVTIEHLTNSVAQIQLTFETLEYLPTEWDDSNS